MYKRQPLQVSAGNVGVALTWTNPSLQANPSPSVPLESVAVVQVIPFPFEEAIVGHAEQTRSAVGEHCEYVYWPLGHVPLQAAVSNGHLEVDMCVCVYVHIRFLWAGHL